MTGLFHMDALFVGICICPKTIMKNAFKFSSFFNKIFHFIFIQSKWVPTFFFCQINCLFAFVKVDWWFVPVQYAKITSHTIDIKSSLNKKQDFFILRDHVPTIFSICGALFSPPLFYILIYWIIIKTLWKNHPSMNLSPKKCILGFSNFFFQKSSENVKNRNMKIF